MVCMLVREKNLNWIIVRQGVTLSDSAIAPTKFRSKYWGGICFSLEVWAPSRASALGSPAFLCGSWTEQLGMRADASPGPNPACMAVKGIDCHRLQLRSGFGMNRSSLRIRLHATLAVLSPFCFEVVLSLVFYLSSSSGQDRGQRENRTDILFSHLLWVITRGVRSKQSNMFF